MSRFIIYALVDPRTGAVRYVGSSSKGLVRPLEHAEPLRLAIDGNRHKAGWIRQLLALGLRYDICALEVVERAELLAGAERRWIACGRAEGWPLTNLTDGGDGTVGYIPGPETRAKQSAVRLGKKRPPGATAAIRSYWIGKKKPPFSPEWCAKLATFAGRKHTPETRAKMSAALVGNTRGAAPRKAPNKNLGRPHTPEHRAAIAKAKALRAFLGAYAMFL